MKGHKYRIGQKVYIQPMDFGPRPPAGDFRVERLMPPTGNDNQYQVQSVYDGHKRVVRESELDLTPSATK
jgi:hypothetical protein